MSKIIPEKNGTRREAIAQKAAGLFIEKGFGATSMRNIADAVGVEAPSLYNHIKSKTEILGEICFKVANLFTSNINRVEGSEHTIVKKLELIIRFHIHMMVDEFYSVYVSDHDWKHLPEPQLSIFKNQRKQYRTRLANIVEAGINNNELNPVNPSVAVLTILSAINGIEYWHRSGKTIGARSLEENIVTILLSGIKNVQMSRQNNVT